MSITSNEALEILKPVPLFQSLDDEQLSKVFLLAGFGQYEVGEYLVREGEDSNDVFVILSGNVSIDMLLPDGQTESFSRLGAGDVLGELALVNFEKRTASAKVEEQVTCLKWDRATLFDLFIEDKDIGFAVMKDLCVIIAQRMVLTNKQLSNFVYRAVYNI